MPSTGLTFTNPIITSRDAPDPWIVRHGDSYLFTATFDDRAGIFVWRSPSLTRLDQDAEKVLVWPAPASGPRCAQIWAPELHFLQGRWYLYYTASDGMDDHHRHYVLRSVSEDALGPYDDLGLVDPAFDHYSIDGSILALPDGRLFWMDTPWGLRIAPMADPARVAGKGVIFHTGAQAWERAWKRESVVGAEGSDSGTGAWRPVEDLYWVEAPEALLGPTGRVFVVYSAGHAATPHYYLGLLELVGPDPLDPQAWRKFPEPVFAPYEGPDGAVYTVGHCSFTKSPDGREDWLVYHGKDGRGDRFAGRTARAQPFRWTTDGAPDFGHPIPAGVSIPRPSGERT